MAEENNTNPYTQGSLLYHHWEADNKRYSSDRYFVWEHHPMLYDNQAKRPIEYSARQAHLLAAAFIVFTGKSSVYVQRSADYFAGKYGRQHLLLERKKLLPADFTIS